MNLIQRIAGKLGAYTTRKKGEEFIFACPKCHRTKFEINILKKMAHCLRCGYSGSLMAIIQELQIRLDETFNYLTDEVNWRLSPSFKEDIPVFFNIPGFKRFTKNNPPTISILDYLAGRGIRFFEERHPSIDKFIGNCGISDEGYLRNRLIIPLVEDNQVVSYVARAIKGKGELKEISGPNKSHYLYNIDAICAGDDVILVEGIFDCEFVKRCNFSCVASLGSNLSDIQAGKLLAKKPRSITLLYDGDLAGREGTFKAWDKLHGRNCRYLNFCILPDDTDPDQLTEGELESVIMEAVGLSIMDFVTAGEPRNAPAHQPKSQSPPPARPSTSAPEPKD